MRDDYIDDEFEDEDEPEFEFPTVVRVAGIIWMVFGGLILFNGLLVLMLIFALDPDGERAPAAVGAMCGGLIFGPAFLFVGVQSARGTAKDTLGNGIGSLVFGLLAAGGGMALLLASPLAAVINFFCALGLLAAGVLALVGRTDYLDWHREQKRARRRRRRRWEDEDDR
jgi:hypothetical protein